MDGDRLVLAGHSLLTIILLALAIIALIEKSRIAFLVWLFLLIFFIALPVILLKFVPKFKRRLMAVEKRVNTEKKRQLYQKKRVAVKKKLSFISKLILKLKSYFPKRKVMTKVENISVKSKEKQEEKPVPEKHKEEKPSEEEIGGPIKIEPLQEKKHVKEKADTNTRIVKTDFDRIIEFVDEKKEVSITDVANHFKVPKEKIEEWAKILSEHGLVDIFYPTFGEARIRKKGAKVNA